MRDPVTVISSSRLPASSCAKAGVVAATAKTALRIAAPDAAATTKSPALACDDRLLDAGNRASAMASRNVSARGRIMATPFVTAFIDCSPLCKGKSSPQTGVAGLGRVEK
jgi:hypothetical protein